MIIMMKPREIRQKAIYLPDRTLKCIYMNYYEVDFSYESSLEPSIISDILASELGEIGFEVSPKMKTGCKHSFRKGAFSEADAQSKIDSFPLEGIRFDYQVKYVESKDWNEEWKRTISNLFASGMSASSRHLSIRKSRDLHIKSPSTKWLSGRATMRLPI